MQPTLVKVKRSTNSSSQDSTDKTTPQTQSSKPKDNKDTLVTTSSDVNSKSSNPEASGEASIPQTNLASDTRGLEQALTEQRQYQRARKMQRFKTSLARGLGTVVAGALPSIHIGDFESGDEIMSDSDLSGDDDIHDDDHHDSHSHDDDDRNSNDDTGMSH